MGEDTITTGVDELLVYLQGKDILERPHRYTPSMG
jgi:hypothetical protein